MRFQFCFLFSLVILYSSSFAQLALRTGERFLQGTDIKKVVVSIEDHTVWALDRSGKVYYKKEPDPDFQLYPLTASFTVYDLSGFSMDEMYFQIGPVKVLQVKSGTAQEISLSIGGVTKINNLSVVYTKGAVHDYYNSDLTSEWTALATNKDMYYILRSESIIKGPYRYVNQPFDDEPGWNISHSGFKSTDFRYEYPSGRCIDTDSTSLNAVASAIYVSTVPEKDPYPHKINNTLFSIHWNNPFRISSWLFIYNFWGTDEGLFVKNWEECPIPRIKKVISGQTINALEEIYALTSIYKQNYVLAGTNDGIFFTRASIFGELYGVQNIDKISFERLAGFPAEKVNSLSVDTRVGASLDVTEGYYSLCEKVVWTATENGITKLYAMLDQEYFKNYQWPAYRYYSGNPLDFEEPIFETCGDQAVTIGLDIPPAFSSQVLIQWFKDGVEQEDWLGKLTVQLKDNGTYFSKVTALCENITLTSNPVIIKNNTEPEIIFDYPEEITQCENTSVTLSTTNNTAYTYQWFRDDNLIPSASTSRYTVTESGNYRVQVSSCPGFYKTSSTVKINFESMARPIVEADKMNYCMGQQAVLKIDNPDAFKIKWYRDGVELSASENNASITTDISGSYTASFESNIGCTKVSLPYQLTFNPYPEFQILRSADNPVCSGEKVTLKVSLDGGQYRWSTGETAQSIEVSAPGEYNVEVISPSGCGISRSIAVDYLPPLRLEQVPDVRICTIAGEGVRLTAEPGFASYTWNGRQGTSNFMDISQPGTYTLEIEDNFGCKASTVYNVVPWCLQVMMPNTFTPNNDGINDYWNIGGLENDPDADIEIFNRYGSKIFHTKGSNPRWDGRIKGVNAPDGVYFFIIHTKNSTDVLKGTVTIIR